MHIRTIIVAAIALLGFAGIGLGQAWIPSELTPTGGASNEYFGWSVAIDGDTCVIGAYGTNSNTGSAYVFTKSGGTWSLTQTLTTTGGASNDQFGDSVAIDGDTCVIGAPGTNSGTGSAYVFTNTGGTWSQVAELTATGGASTDFFGSSLDLNGDTCVIGALYTNSGTGSAYVFTNTGGTWGQVAELNATGGASNDFFGSSVDLDGSTCVIGAPGTNSGTGSAYVFTNTGGTWSQVAELTATGGAISDQFGCSVAIDGSTCVIGALYTNSGTGSAYVFTNTGGTWSQAAELTATGGANLNYFGGSVAIDGSTCLIGAPGTGDESSTGKAYVFTNTGGTWSQIQTLTATGGAGGNQFGWSVAIDGSTCVIGAYGTNSETGSAYFFTNSGVYNVRLDTWHDTIQDAVQVATDHDTLVIGGATFDIDDTLDLRSRALTFQSRSITADFGLDLLLLAGGNTSFISHSNVVAGGGQTLYRVEGTLITPEDESILFSDLDVTGTLTQSGASLIFETSMDNSSGTSYLEGDIFCNDGMVTTGIDGTNKITGDTNVLGDFSNAGTTTIQRGILYIYGDLYNTGTITGDYNNGFAGGSAPEPGDGFSIGGSYTVGQGATLSMPHPVWWLRVGGDLDIEIDDPADFTMSEATIELHGLAPGNLQTLEALSADLGADQAGFDPSNFPIGALRITGDSTTQVVNNHPNSTDDACEAIYVNELVVAAGGELITNGCPIYTHTATIDGTVDNPDDIIIIDEPCQGDLDGNGVIGVLDLLAVLDEWGCSRDCSADFDGNGNVNIIDLLIVIQYWGACGD